MCLGSSSSKPKLQQRTLPAEGTRPADESAKTSGGKVAAKARGGVWDVHPGVMHDRAQKEWAEKGHLDDMPSIKRSDPGINV